MSEAELLKKMAEDLSFLKDKIAGIEISLDEIEQDLHRKVNPEYLKKLEDIKKQKGIRFKNVKDLDEYLSA